MPLLMHERHAQASSSMSREPPQEGASRVEKMIFLEKQLDSLGTEKAFKDRLVLTGSGAFERMQGGAHPRNLCSQLRMK